MNSLVGVAAALATWAGGLGDPVLWGVSAFLLNFIPIVWATCRYNRSAFSWDRCIRMALARPAACLPIPFDPHFKGERRNYTDAFMAEAIHAKPGVGHCFFVLLVRDLGHSRRAAILFPFSRWQKIICDRLEEDLFNPLDTSSEHN